MGGDMVLYFFIGCLVILLVGMIVNAIIDMVEQCRYVTVEEIVAIILWIIGFLTVPTIVGYIVYLIATHFIG